MLRNNIKKLLASFLAIVMAFSMSATLVSCDFEDIDDATAESTAKKEEANTDSDNKNPSLGTESDPEGGNESDTEPSHNQGTALPEPVYPYLPPIDDKFINSQMNFAVDLFKETVAQREKDSSQLISPLSVMIALAMTENGARGETLEDMEAVLGGMSREELNGMLLRYIQDLPSSKEYKLGVANSIWFRDDSDRVTVKEAFLNKNQALYKAEVRKEPFDEETLNKINNWVSEKTDGMIDSVLDEIPASAIMYLINAIVFDAKWQNTYSDYQVIDGEFYALDGTIKRAKMMSSEETKYIYDDKAKGFIKYYDDHKYAFVALLPDADVNIYDYIAQLDPTVLYNTVTNARSTPVYVKLPQFSYSYDIEMSKVLSEMGMGIAFDHNRADFSDMAVSSEGNVAINRVLHKTFIDVTQYGTRAAAVTVVEPSEGGAPDYGYVPEVILDRPFVYMIIDNNSSLPVFMGTVTDIEGAETVGSFSEIEPSYNKIISFDYLYKDRYESMLEEGDLRTPIIKIESAEELNLFKHRSGTNQLADLDTTFFKNNDLVLVSIMASSGSFRYELTSCKIASSENGTKLMINVMELSPKYGFTDDVVCWLVCLGIPKTELSGRSPYKVTFSHGLLEEEPSREIKECVRVDGCGNLQDRFSPMIDASTSGCSIMMIESRKELDALNVLLNEEEGYFMLDNTQSGTSYNAICERLDDEYFEEYGIVIIYVTETGGSNRLDLRISAFSSLAYGSGILSYKIARILPGDGMDGTADMAGWFVCATVNKSFISSGISFEVEFINEYSTDGKD